MANRISVRQICFILIAYNACAKILNYPTYMAYLCGNALLFPALFNIILQTGMVFGICYLSSKTNKTFYKILCDGLGEVTARIIFAFFALFFIMNAIIPMIEQQLFVHESFYDTIPSILAFLPFFVFGIYAGGKRFTNIGRTADMCLPIFIVTVIVIFVMSISKCDFGQLLPVLKQSFGQVATASTNSILRFSDSAFLIMFVGCFKYKKSDCAKITISYAVGGLIILLFMAIFYAVYGQLSPIQPFAIAKIPIFFSAINLIGRVDLFALYLLDIALLFAIILNVQMCSYCLEMVTCKPLRGIYSLSINGILMVISIIFTNNFVALNDFFYKWLWITSLLFAYVLPIVGIILGIVVDKDECKTGMLKGEG